MSETSRRKFLAAAGASAAAGAAVTAVTARADAADRAGGKGTNEPVLAVLEPGSNRLVLLVGEREVQVTDADLASRIRRAAGGK